MCVKMETKINDNNIDIIVKVKRCVEARMQMKQHKMGKRTSVQRVEGHTARFFLVSCMAMSVCASPAFAAERP